MARPTKRRVPGGRVTPKGGGSSGGSSGGRYTPPIPVEEKVSPRWVPVLMFGCLAVGAVIIFCNYLGLVPGGETSNWYLLVGLGFILVGIVTATQYH